MEDYIFIILPIFFLIVLAVMYLVDAVPKWRFNLMDYYDRCNKIMEDAGISVGGFCSGTKADRCDYCRHHKAQGDDW